MSSVEAKSHKKCVGNVFDLRVCLKMWEGLTSVPTGVCLLQLLQSNRPCHHARNLVKWVINHLIRFHQSISSYSRVFSCQLLVFFISSWHLVSKNGSQLNRNLILHNALEFNKHKRSRAKQTSKRNVSKCILHRFPSPRTKGQFQVSHLDIDIHLA